MPGCGSGVLVSSSSLLIRSHHGRCQAKIPLSPLFKFAEPPLTSFLRGWGSFEAPPTQKWLIANVSKAEFYNLGVRDCRYGTVGSRRGIDCAGLECDLLASRR